MNSTIKSMVCTWEMAQPNAEAQIINTVKKKTSWIDSLYVARGYICTHNLKVSFAQKWPQRKENATHRRTGERVVP